MSVGGRTMLQRCVDGLLASGAVDEVVVVVGADQLERAATLVGPGATVVQGGAERTDSVRAGLAAVDAADWILVHDAARPLTPPDMIARIVAELRTGRGAVIPAVAVTDTIKSIDVHGDVIGTPDRAGLRAVQTPQGFAADVLRRAYAAAGDIATDDAALVEQIGESVHVVEGDRLAFKITTTLDMTLAEAILSATEGVQ
ncbi:2-C-methyl-D-erythritol 4-phosphate cytidylyltransferase [Mycobacteroides abscessus 5S-0422]|uniref:2-C-methyl-D-erythritol 4-phosphate cytidylyltransferase n=1 Tax=Mycobacteroides abscessus subsp. bolletii 1513 TaxID=1299321 RepID=X8DZT8_9MYCO|nr:2-C-methyl-D-erythritol 4-phosphate cytidylyltransferase [Mycobacteroides abscessus 5S-0421]EIU12098.1 2-C-methyl-D-erythritol 4-phosphate cytidylyltransferase [Mycobacteroides abscessus 5S-0304]EIU19355.1 2-C-methyl-D-erythritol 4-phosphate cytidylyltransferase [Mycobacteroides abscessus 5S-0422]EIU29107.1 2-C-methyl-D-erythritol 4-phosphate cytidylyltransferase [Mycobacteroides abscessus 5S-1212]EIU34539.1 2-C-methyl-D-erythritol 4-phosphate cytidylyltransferase [Mycobacteroides abscessus 